MKRKISREEAKKKIDEFFSRKERLSEKEIKKIKRLAMLYNFKLRKYRRRFCKKCFGDLKHRCGEIRIGKTFKVVECGKCGFKNRWKIK